MKKYKSKKMLLSVVALALILVFAVSATYSWIEDITLVEFNTETDKDGNNPLTVGDKINAEVKVVQPSDYDNPGYIDLGAIINESKVGDLTTRTVAERGYFYESGEMHLSPCYGNGKDFYFPIDTVDGNADNYRRGDHDDENVNYISMTVKVSSPTANTEFWFDTFDITLKDSTNNAIVDADDYVRFSVTVDGSTAVYSNDGSYKTVDSTIASAPTSRKGEVLGYYTYSDSNVHSQRGKYGNTLFYVGEKETKTVNFKIWLEKPASSVHTLDDVSISDINIKLVSSWAKKRRITLEDKTTGAGAESWADDDDARMFLVIPDLDKTGWYNNASSVARMEFTSSHKDSNGNMYLEVPAVYNGKQMYIFRTNSNGLKNVTDTATKGGPTYELKGPNDVLDSYDIFGWNYWDTSMPDTFHDEVYTLYGGSYDGTADDYYGTASVAGTSDTYGNATYLGYGTWSGTMPIFIKNRSTNTKNLISYKSPGTTHLFVEDYSDWASAGKVYIYTMYGSGTSISNTVWTVNIPKTSTRIEFSYSWGNTVGYWGWATQTGSTTRRSGPSSSSWYTSGGYARPTNNNGAVDLTYYNTFEVTASGDNSGRGLGEWINADNGSTATTASATSASVSTDDMSGYNTGTGFSIYANNGYRGDFRKNGSSGTTYKAVTSEDITTSGYSFKIIDKTNKLNKGYYIYLGLESNMTDLQVTRTVPFENTQDLILHEGSIREVIIKTNDSSQNGKYVITFVITSDNNIKITSIKKYSGS